MVVESQAISVTEDEIVRPLMAASKPFAAFYAAERGKIKRPIHWYVDPTLEPYGRSIPAQGAIVLRPSHQRNPHTVAHELKHLVLCYVDGYRLLHSKVEDEVMCGVLSGINGLLIETVVNQCLSTYGFNSLPFTLACMDQERKIMQRVNACQHPNRSHRLWAALTALSRILEYRYQSGQTRPGKYERWYKQRFSETYKEIEGLDDQIGNTDFLGVEGYNDLLFKVADYCVNIVEQDNGQQF